MRLQSLCGDGRGIQKEVSDGDYTNIRAAELNPGVTQEDGSLSPLQTLSSSIFHDCVCQEPGCKLWSFCVCSICQYMLR